MSSPAAIAVSARLGDCALEVWAHCSLVSADGVLVLFGWYLVAKAESSNTAGTGFDERNTVH